MFNSLIYWKDRDVTGSGEASGIEKLLQVNEGTNRPVRTQVHTIDVIRPRQMECVLRNGLALMLQKAICICTENFLNSSDHRFPPCLKRSHRLSPIQCCEYQAEDNAEKNRRTEWKVKTKIFTLVMEIQRKPSEPKRKFRTQHQQETDDGDDDAHDHEQSTELLHISILAADPARYPAISSWLKKYDISNAAVSGPSDPWIAFRSMLVANSFRIVPASALAGSVAPITLRSFSMALSASRTIGMIGPSDMNFTRLPKNGRS